MHWWDNVNPFPSLGESYDDSQICRNNNAMERTVNLEIVVVVVVVVGWLDVGCWLLCQQDPR